MKMLSLFFVVGMGISSVSHAYYEKVSVKGAARGFCYEKDDVTFDRAHANGMEKVGFTIGCTDWNDEVEEMGFPNCDYKKAVSKRTCTVNPF